jgi:uncharacterized protein with NRDE domain
MCLILISWKTHPDYKLVLAANRDEFYDRPTQQANFWEDYPNVLAGKDLQAGGTWIGVTKSGRIAALTNYRDPQNIDANAASRGQITTNFLNGTDVPEQYLMKLKNSGTHYNGFNLIVGDGNSLYHYNNVNHDIHEIHAGTFGLSNGFFQENWPKIKKGRNALELLIKKEQFSNQDLLDILGDGQKADDSELPKTGIPLEWERALSPLFISADGYGTRCSTIITSDNKDNTNFLEKTYAVGGQTESIIEFQL